MKTTSKVQSEHTQSLHYMNTRQVFTSLICIPPINFHFAQLAFVPSSVISLQRICSLSHFLTTLSKPWEKFHMELKIFYKKLKHQLYNLSHLNPPSQQNNSCICSMPMFENLIAKLVGVSMTKTFSILPFSINSLWNKNAVPHLFRDVPLEPCWWG